MGEQTLHLQGPNFSPTTVRGVVTADGALDLGTITVEQGRTVAGRVVDGQGGAVAECEVAGGALLTGDGSTLFIADESIRAQSTQTDAEGRFVLTGFGRHPVTLVAGNEQGRSRPLRLSATSDETNLTLVLEPSAALRGSVTLDGKAVAETVVIATAIGSSSSYFVVSGLDGSFAYDTLPVGDYIVFPMIGGGGARPKDMYVVTAKVLADGGTVLPIRASSGNVSLMVTLQTSSGEPFEGQVLVLEDGAGRIANGLYPGDAFMDGSWLRGQELERPIAISMRGAAASGTRFDRLRSGRVAICVAPRAAGPPAEMQCTSRVVERGAGLQAVTVMVLEADSDTSDP